MSRKLKLHQNLKRKTGTLHEDLCGPGSSLGIVTGYGVDGPGIENRWRGEISRTSPDRPWGPPSLLYSGYRLFHGGIGRQGRGAEHSLPSSAVVKKEQSYTSTHL